MAVIELDLARAKPDPKSENGRAPGCNHAAPTRSNRFCDSCGALIIAHEYRICPEGHFVLSTRPGGARTINLWCWECEAFRPCARASVA